MLAISELHNITFEDLKSSIEEANNKPSNIKYLKAFYPNLPQELCMKCINTLLMEPSKNIIMLKANNLIEWTPVQICQSVYFMVRTNNLFWIVNYSNVKIITSYYTSINDYFVTKVNKTTGNRLISYYGINDQEVLHVYNYMKAMEDKSFLFIKTNKIQSYHQMPTNNNIVNHYMFKYNNHYYYFPITKYYDFDPVMKM